MANPYMKAPHADPGRLMSPEAPNAALLIDFDNVTLGMRSDLAKELKRLLNSDLIKGKVTVQRAYADWRRYPQYIVPLSEASIDLIFAPAYGSSKKNATDIRMAIDGMELVFIRPEIGTFILLTGDSDFSSLVLKLKEYGKYVIGIGIQESSSDILVQNCDEYYSYTALAGLHKTTEEEGTGEPDAWQCVEEAVGRMVSRGDVMRSDRLKQVMMEMSPGFDERTLGFKSFSRFLVEAANKGLVDIQRGQNGQYQIAPPGGSAETITPPRRSDEAAANGQERRGKERRAPAARRPAAGRGGRDDRDQEARAEAPRAPSGREPAPRKDPGPALELLGRAVRELTGQNREVVRDSDLKRKMLAIDRKFDESTFGFGKFSKFLQFAEGKGDVVLGRLKGGSFEVGLAPRKTVAQPAVLDLRALGLPVTEQSIKSYFANRYKGVGVKTAERLVEEFGAEVFGVLQNAPQRVGKVLSQRRAETVLDNWAADYKRRSEALAKAAPPAGASGGRGPAPAGSTRHRRGLRGRDERAARPASTVSGRNEDQDQPRLGLGEANAVSESAQPGASQSVDDREAAAVSQAPAKSGLRGLLPWGRRKRGPPGKPGGAER